MWEVLGIIKTVGVWAGWLGIGVVPLLIGAAIIWFRPALLRPVLIGAGAWVGVFALATYVDVRATSRADARWEAKWKAAEVQAEKDRQSRDAFAKAKLDQDADGRIAALAARKAELEQKVQAYEDDEARRVQPAVPGKAVTPARECPVDGSDERWLRDAQRKSTDAKPKASRRSTDILRAFGR